MKNTVIFLGFVLLFVILSSCREKSVNPDDSTKGAIYVTSDPEYAVIYFNDITTGKITPDSILNLDPGFYKITLRKIDYRDTTIFVDVNTSRKAVVDVKLRLYSYY